MSKEGKNKHKALRIICIILVSLILLLSAELLYSNFALTVSRYEIRDQRTSNRIRIAFISDLHSREFGKDNARLLRKIAGEEPDLIAFAGDIINSDADEEEVERMLSLISAASGIAPVYFGLGNHENDYLSTHGDSLLSDLSKAGAVVLDRRYLDISVNGTPIRIGGYSGYYRTPQMSTFDPDKQADDFRFFDDFENTDRFKVLICHIPLNWLDWNYRNRSPVDLVLSGHYHGGVIRIPIIDKGLFAPYVGKYPPYTKGFFVGKKANVVLTTGLAGSKGIPRVFNPPEIVVVNIAPET